MTTHALVPICANPGGFSHENAARMLALLAVPPETIALRGLWQPRQAEEKHFANPALALDWLARHDGTRALYAVLNPIKPDAVPSIKDDQIAALRWFPLDADPKRPADTASTNAELRAAQVKMAQMIEFVSQYIPTLSASLVQALSGNGAHALLRLPDYDPAEAPRLKRLGDALSRWFSDDLVGIDRSIYNPSRIWRVYGTLNLKGTNTSERPHRRARLLSAKEFVPVPLDLLAYEELLLSALGVNLGADKVAKSHKSAEPSSSEGAPLPPWWGEAISAGGRNVAAHRRARWLINKTEGHRTEDDAWELLKAWNLTCCRPSLNTEELGRTFTSACQAGDNPDYVAPKIDTVPPEPLAWETPISFTSQNLPAFPVEALPPVLAAYVSEIAVSSQVPPDMPAMLALAVVAVAGGRRAVVQIGGTHSEPLNLFVAVVMDSGSRKSGMMDMAAPLREHEAVLVRREAPTIAAAKESRAVEEKRISSLREQAAKEKDVHMRAEKLSELHDMAANLPEVPAVPRLLADNITTETVATLMSENEGALALLSPEGGLFGILAGRYSGKGDPDLDVFLKGHASDEIRVDRKSRPPDFVRRPALTVGLLVQPDVIASLADSPSFRGRGLLGRFLYSLPESLAGKRKYQDRPVDRVIKAQYDYAIEQILNLPGAGTEDDPTARHFLPLTGDALALWAAFADDVEARQAEGSDLAGVRDWASKLAGQVARIAGGFHLLASAGGDWRQPICPEAVAAAWAIGQYLIPHALAAFGQMGADPRLALARRIVRWIERALTPDTATGEAQFTLRDCQRAHTGGGQVLTADDVQAALLVLVERVYIRPVQAKQETGGRPGSAAYAVNPAVFTKTGTGN